MKVVGILLLYVRSQWQRTRFRNKNSHDPNYFRFMKVVGVLLLYVRSQWQRTRFRNKNRSDPNYFRFMKVVGILLLYVRSQWQRTRFYNKKKSKKQAQARTPELVPKIKQYAYHFFTVNDKANPITASAKVNINPV